ncbi:MAG TPA: NAD(P)H-hydrate dehydratase [Actinomycetota bacterium]|nr:NAD(P)H-hydrate dehydratase [Actinomycetota bacterium]
MIPVLAAEDVRRQDAECKARGISTSFLMGNAGFAVATAARSLLGGTYGRRVVVVCGKGNNAGDGLVAGRRLAAWGAKVSAVMLLGNELSGAAGQALAAFPGRVLGPEALDRELGRSDLAIDSLFGVGLSRAPKGAVAVAIERLSSGETPVLAVDVPSGVNADTGAIVEGRAVRAGLTVTLGGLKPGLLFEPGRSAAGRVDVADIGVPEDLRTGTASALEAADVRALLPRRQAASNKRRVGTVLVVVGSRGLPGAASLTAGACVHGGAGLTVVAAPESVVSVIVGRVPEVTAIPLPETGDGTIDPKAIELIRPRLGEFHAVAIGPGLSTHPATAELVRALVAELGLPMVLDADALTAFTGAAELLAQAGAPKILTPHTRELSRLTGRSDDDIEADRLAATRAAAASMGTVVLLKGPGTVIASPDGAAYLNPTGGPSLAQGGTGDVLTGLTAALLAQDLAVGERRGVLLVAALAAWIHGRAGDLASQRYGPHPASASMLIELLPEVLHEVAG